MFDSQNRKMNFGLLIILKSDSIFNSFQKNHRNRYGGIKFNDRI